jgi:hypothetical protein
MGTNTATPFLWSAGTSNNGLLVSAVTLMTTELNSLGIGSGIVSNANGLATNGVFNNTLTGQAAFGDVSFLSGGAFTPAAGGNITGWFIRSRDGGTTYEYSGAVPTRSPDFVISLIPATYAANQQAWSQGIHAVRVPATYFKVYVQNNSTVALFTSANTLVLSVVGLAY